MEGFESPPMGVAPVLPLRVEAVSFFAGGAALLDGVSFTLVPGTRTLVLGPNGAGKSLLLRVCHGLLAPGRGALRWANPDREQLRRAQAMVFQRPVLLRRSVAANVRYALAVRGVERHRRDAVCARVLERTGLGTLARRQARVLSGGEQQRLALARAWALEPQILFLDEPTASLDPAGVRAVEDLIGAIHASGTKVVMTTHDLGQARRLGDDIVFMHRGRCLEHSPGSQFFAHPSSEAARAYLDGRLLA